MSLDVHLSRKGPQGLDGEARIFIREDGQTKEISRDEWYRRFPDRTPITVEPCDEEEVYWANITHNLNRMAGEAGIYEALWRPDEIGITKAGQLVEPLRAGIALLKSDPNRFKAHDAKNGWGTYEQFVPWVEKYLAACEEAPDADVSVSR